MSALLRWQQALPGQGSSPHGWRRSRILLLWGAAHGREGRDLGRTARTPQSAWCMVRSQPGPVPIIWGLVWIISRELPMPGCQLARLCGKRLLSPHVRFPLSTGNSGTGELCWGRGISAAALGPRAGGQRQQLACSPSTLPCAAPWGVTPN